MFAGIANYFREDIILKRFILSSHQNSDSRAFSQILNEGIMKALTQDDETKNIYLIAITLRIERS